MTARKVAARAASVRDGPYLHEHVFPRLRHRLGTELLARLDVFVELSTLGEYGLDGSTLNASLISGINSPADIAIRPVPEPSAVALAGLGAATLWLWRRCK